MDINFVVTVDVADGSVAPVTVVGICHIPALAGGDVQLVHCAIFVDIVRVTLAHCDAEEGRLDVAEQRHGLAVLVEAGDGDADQLDAQVCAVFCGGLEDNAGDVGQCRLGEASAAGAVL